MNEEKFETGFYRILIDDVFSVAEMTEDGWRFIDGDCWGAVTIIDKLSERQSNTELPNEENTKALGISDVVNCSTCTKLYEFTSNACLHCTDFSLWEECK